MAGILDIFGRHTVTVQTYTGVNATGETWASALTFVGWVEDQTHLVRNGKDEEVTSTSIIYMPISSAVAFAADSKVTLPSGRIARVINTNANDAGGLPLPEHVEVHLT